MTGSFGDGIPIPDVIDPPESMEMTLCIPKNRDHMAAFFGALYQLTVWNSWQQDGTQHGKELAAVWWRYYLSWDRAMNDIDCEDGMGNCCTEPAIIQRVNPTTGQIEQSSNNGATWTPAAGGWQSIIVQPVPPVTSGVAATKCDAATNLSGQVQVWIDHVVTDFDTATTLLEFGLALVAAIAAAVLAVLTDGLTIPMIAPTMAALGAALAAVWAVGKTVFQDYWTTEIKDAILCAAFCTIGDDGSFTDAQFSAFWNKVNSTIPPAPAKMLFMGFLSSVGTAGVNAMAASGMSADSDCEDCEPCVDTCAQLWLDKLDAGYTYGHITEQTDTFVVVTCDVPNTNGVYYANIWTASDTMGCYTTDSNIQLVSGAAFNINWRDNPGGGGLVGGLFGGRCVNWLQLNAPAPFVVKVLFAACP